MEQLEKQQLNEILIRLSEALDLTPSQFDEAESHYNAVSEYLLKPGTSLVQYQPEIFPQGSFGLGTMIKPISENDEFDIDLVCELKKPSLPISQYQLKNLVGDRLKEDFPYKKMLDKEEGRRCWTIDYADGTRFHLDILPAIPDSYQWLLAQHVNQKFAEHAILITDKNHPNYRGYGNDWPKGNPTGFREWFKQQMKTFETQRMLLAESLKMSIEQIPDWRVKTPLQRAIQILKRHRDIMFDGDKDKPASIIITTLAALAYSQEDNVYDALINILEHMPKFIEERYDPLKGRYVKWISNPVNPTENFADRWIENSKREKNFYDWIRKAKAQLSSVASEKGLHNLKAAFQNSFGARAVNEAFGKIADHTFKLRDENKLKMATGTGILGAEGRASVPHHNFYGGE